VVLGHPEYYPRFGFRSSHTFNITCEYDVSPEVFMVKELSEGALEGVGGLARYHAAFEDV
jgi:putative acetyltransferase